MVGASIHGLWTPLAVAGLAIVLGAGMAWWQIAHSKRAPGSLLRGAAFSGSLYVTFLLLTAGMIAANRYAVQLPFGIGPVYSYDPNTQLSDSSVVTERPESSIIAYLEGEQVFPSESTWAISLSGPDRLAFVSSSGYPVQLHPVRSYRLGHVLIRRVPTELWWDDDPTFLASVELSVEFEDIGDRDAVVGLVSGSIVRNDFLGLRTQGYLTPSLGDWRPERLLFR